MIVSKNTAPLNGAKPASDLKILLFGKRGQVGWELQRSLAALGQVTAVDFDSKELGGNFADPGSITETVRTVSPDIIVNAAAYTAVDKAEDEVNLCETINATTPGLLAKEAKRQNAWLVHYSTDYVFDGSGDEARLETDPTGPLSVYGRTKLEGEAAIRESGCRHLIFRTSWVYASRGSNFPKTILRLAKERETLKIVDDQIGAPTSAELIADVTALCLRQALQNPEVSGLYHLVTQGSTSWFNYAQFIVRAAKEAGLKLKVNELSPCPSSAYPVPAKRPKNSRLNTEKLRNTFDLNLPTWETNLSRTLEDFFQELK